MDLLDGYGWLLVVSIGLAALTFYLGFLHPFPEAGSPGHLFWAFMQGRNRGGFIFVVAVLVPLSTWLVWQAGRVEAQIEAFIAPYPNASGTVVVPDVDGDPDARTYLVTTGDPAESVMAFYSEPANHEGWELIESTGAILQFGRAGQSLFVVTTAEDGDTTIAYLLGTR